MTNCLRVVPRVRKRRPSSPLSGPPMMRIGQLRADRGMEDTKKKRVSSELLLAEMKSSIALSGTTIGDTGLTPYLKRN